MLSTDLIELNHRKNLVRWQQLVSDCRNSGLSVKNWCAQNGITEKSYYYRQRKVWEAVRELQEIQEAGAEQESPTIIPCSVPLAGTSLNAATTPALILRNKSWTMEVNPGCDPELLRLVLRTVK